MTPAAFQTFAALAVAHMLGDFVLQSAWMVRHKRNVFVLLAHVVVHFALAALALGGVWQVALVVALSHLVIDMVKTYAPQRLTATATAFLIDQALHLAALAVIAQHWPVFPTGGLAPWPLTPVFLTLAGLIAAVLAGGHAVGLLTQRFSAEITQKGLPEAGRLIGQLERALIFLLILVDQPAAIGFLIAAKSILRFNDASEDQRTAEYVIIGTLASFLWALMIGFGTVALLEISGPTP